MRPRNPPDPQQFGWCWECWGWHLWSTGEHGRADDLLLPLGSSLAGIRRLHLSAIFTFLVWTCSVSLDGRFFFCLSPLRCWLPLRLLEGSLELPFFSFKMLPSFTTTEPARTTSWGCFLYSYFPSLTIPSLSPSFSIICPRLFTVFKIKEKIFYNRHFKLHKEKG